jgi:purine-nucleoside phosphorylase
MFDAFVKICRQHRPRLCMVLGSGMGQAADAWGRTASIKFVDIPGLVGSSVQGHRGQLSLAIVAGKPVLVFEGRLHFYEGHPWECVTEPARIASRLGVEMMLHTNAAGGIAEPLTPGSLMALSDHLDLTRGFPQGPVSPPPYSKRLLALLTRAAKSSGITLHQGVYASVTGPSYETKAEIRAFMALGADTVGMSTTREVQAGGELGLECAAVSCITNRATGLSDKTLTHEEVLETANRQIQMLVKLIEAFVVVASEREQ